MSVEILVFAGAIDGDLPLNPSHAATYYGGQPAMIDANGVNVCTSHTTYIGFLKNDVADDAGTSASPQVQDSPATGFLSTSVIFGANKLRLTQAAAGQVFVYSAGGGGAGAWAAGQEVYITAAGILDNNPVAGTDPSVGKVVKAPTSATDDMHIYQYPTSITVANK